ncbi:golgin-84-like isoform X2 [Panicum virgatum]|uniref:Uncharacterized protein n=1 Tax=Panicum virgatum TaxID=38727 RepID=A0A8T0PWK5_PANVG|nr:golgin-84-like isoform X2 [Panicum virgatum]KAG2565288.1 hypothetical protein PVAP13_7NG063200 [Panicum virgatum]
MIAPCKTLAKQKGTSTAAPLAGPVEQGSAPLGQLLIRTPCREMIPRQERPPSLPPVSAGLGETRDGSPESAAGSEASPMAGTVEAKHAVLPPPDDVINLDSPEDRDTGAFVEILTSNADVVLPNAEVRAAEEERGPSAEEVVMTGSDDARPKSGAGDAPETDVNAADSTLVTGSKLPLDSAAPPSNSQAGASPASDVSASSPAWETGATSKDDATLSLTGPVSMEAGPLTTTTPALTPSAMAAAATNVGAQTSRAVKATAGSSASIASSEEVLNRFTAEVIAQGGEGVSFDPTTQNFTRRELDFGWLRKVVIDVVTVMHGLLGPLVVEMELWDEERLALWVQGQTLLEARQTMEEELASLRRSLEDERVARAADHNEAYRVLIEKLARSSSVASELEQLQKERDELRVGFEAVEQAREAAVQGRNSAIQEHDAAIQERDVAMQEHDAETQRRNIALSTTEEALEGEKTTISSSQNAHNESKDLRQELTRVDSQRKEVEAAVASLTVDVATHRATQQRLEGTVVRLQDEAATANSLRRETESKLLEMKEALELQVTVCDNLRLVVGLMLDDLGVEAAAAPGQFISQLLEGVDGLKQVVQATRQEVEVAGLAARDAVYTGVHHAFAVARSHYVNIDLEELSKGYPGDYADAELDAFEEETASFTQNLADKMLEDDED